MSFNSDSYSEYCEDNTSDLFLGRIIQNVRQNRDNVESEKSYQFVYFFNEIPIVWKIFFVVLIELEVRSLVHFLSKKRIKGENPETENELVLHLEINSAWKDT